MGIFGTILMAACIDGGNYSLNISKDDNDQSSAGKKNWKIRFPSMWAAAYAQDVAVEPDPETVTYEQFVNDVAKVVRSKQVVHVEFQTANGTRPDGRYGFYPSVSANTQAKRDAEAMAALQGAYDTSADFVNSTISEIKIMKPDICYPGFVLQSGLGDVRVIRVNEPNPNAWDYRMLVTCAVE